MTEGAEVVLWEEDNEDGERFSPPDLFALPNHLTDDDPGRKPRWWYAAQLRIAGATWVDIAEALGYHHPGDAKRAVVNGKSTLKINREDAQEIVELELDRLDMMQVIAWKAYQRGDLKAGQMIVSIMGHRMKLLGIERKPNEGAGNTTNTAIFIGGTEADYVAALKQAREAVTQQGEI